MKAVKFWAAAVGGAATSAIVIFGGDTVAGKIAAVISAGITAGLVYAAENDTSGTSR